MPPFPPFIRLLGTVAAEEEFGGFQGGGLGWQALDRPVYFHTTSAQSPGTALAPEK